MRLTARVDYALRAACALAAAETAHPGTWTTSDDVAGAEGVPHRFLEAILRDLQVVTALLAGGVLAAPLAAYLVRHVPARVLGAAVGGLIVLTNSRTMLRASDLEASIGWGVYGLGAAVWALALAAAVTRYRRERDTDPAGLPAPRRRRPAGTRPGLNPGDPDWSPAEIAG